MTYATPQNVASTLQDVIRLMGTRDFWNLEKKQPEDMFLKALEGVTYCVNTFYKGFMTNQETLHIETLKMVWEDIVRCYRGLNDEEVDIVTSQAKSYKQGLEFLHHITNEIENSISFSIMEQHKSDRLPLNVVTDAQNAIYEAWSCLQGKSYERLNQALTKITNLGGFPKGTFTEIKLYLKNYEPNEDEEWEVFTDEDILYDSDDN